MEATSILIRRVDSLLDAVAALRVDEVVAAFASRTGRPYRNRYVAIFEMRSDRVAMSREYFDPTAVSEALTPAPGPR